MPVPLACVFQPENVKLVRAKFPEFVGRVNEPPETVTVDALGTEPLVALLLSYVTV